MKNLNLTGLFLAISARFGMCGFELSSIIPENGQPIDVMIQFNSVTLTKDDIADINGLVLSNLNGDVKQLSVTLKDYGVQIYIEFVNSNFTEKPQA